MVCKGVNLTPLICPFRLASYKNKLRPSVTNRKRKGERVHPCLRPREAQKKLEGAPLIKEKNEMTKTHPIV